MGCFLACLGGPKERRRRRRSPKRTLPLTPSHELYKALRPTPLLEQLNHDSPKNLLSDKEIGACLSEIRENPQKDSPASNKKKVTFDLNVTTYEDPNHCDVEANETIQREQKEQERLEDERFSSKSSSFPLNHRYQNCEIGDEDGSELEDDDSEEDGEYEDYDSDEERVDDEVVLIRANEDSYDSYFSLPNKEQPSLQEANSPNPNRTSSPEKQQQQHQPIVAAKYNARDRSQYVHSVLNPVANLSQWKEVKVRAAPEKNPRKENINVEPALGANKPQMLTDTKQVTSVCAKKEISVDASLSNWLLSSKNSTVEGLRESYTNRSNSPISREERPILGALTVDDIKQSSVTSTPRRSPSKSPDDMPILGIVGTYWNSKCQGADSASSNKSSNEVKGIPNATTKYREDRRVKWNSTPFEVRLERAMKEDAT